MSKPTCEYCGQPEKLDGFGYCIKYSCFVRSGKNIILDSLIKRAGNLYFDDKTAQVSGPVTNSYSVNHRKADGLKYEATKEFGFVPFELLERMPLAFRYDKWDRNIRW